MTGTAGMCDHPDGVADSSALPGLSGHQRASGPFYYNSKRRSTAASDYKPMTSVFYDVIRLESVRGRSNMLIEGHF